MNRNLLCIAAVIVLFSANRLQAVEMVIGQPTQLLSSAEGAISLRFQNHSWMTSNGVTHLLFNTGSNSGALELWSGSDAVDWSRKSSIPRSSRGSQADGVLDESSLYVAYPTSAGEIRLAVFRLPIPCELLAARTRHNGGKASKHNLRSSVCRRRQTRQDLDRGCFGKG
jgi:hypothetical protein